jgi:hypothetical protein
VNKVIAAIVAGLCLLACTLAAWTLRKGGVGDRAFESKLTLIEQRTESKIQRNSTRAVLPAALPLSYRIKSQLKSIFISRTDSFLRPTTWENDYTVQSGENSLKLSLFVAEDQVYIAFLTAPRSSEGLAKKWSAVLREMFPTLTVKLELNLTRQP